MRGIRRDDGRGFAGGDNREPGSMQVLGQRAGLRPSEADAGTLTPRQRHARIEDGDAGKSDGHPAQRRHRAPPPATAAAPASRKTSGSTLAPSSRPRCARGSSA